MEVNAAREMFSRSKKKMMLATQTTLVMGTAKHSKEFQKIILFKRKNVSITHRNEWESGSEIL